jgi:hypothetical protein
MRVAVRSRSRICVIGMVFAALKAVAACGPREVPPPPPAPVTIYYPVACPLDIPPPMRREADLDPETLTRAKAQLTTRIGSNSIFDQKTWGELFEMARAHAREQGCDAILLREWAEADETDKRYFPHLPTGIEIDYSVFRTRPTIGAGAARAREDTGRR